MIVSNDAIELIEENLHSSRNHELCERIISISERLWCLSLRKCTISDIDFEKLIRTLRRCKQLRYINLNLNLLNSFERVTCLTTLIPSMANLDTLCVHSSNLKDDGLKILYYSLINNAHFKSIDIGDCDLSDSSVPFIRELIHRREHPRGLSEIILSNNPKITADGWSKILIAAASASRLKHFYADYNKLNDDCGYLIAAILTTNHSIEVIDLEHTGLTDKTANLLIYLVKNYDLSIKTLNLLHNQINESLLNELKHLMNNEFESGYLKNKNKSSDAELGLKTRDQIKLDKFVKDGNRFNYEKGFDDQVVVVGQYERNLEKNVKSMKQEKANLKDKTNQNEDESMSENSEMLDGDGETLMPVGDLRFKKHSVLPFNMRK